MNNLERIKSKIIAQSELESMLALWKLNKPKIVFTNGCFDIIHRGHIEYLAQAASFGDLLVIGLNSDKSVRELKGENRPVKDEYTRALLLASFSFVSFVVVFDSSTPYNLINAIKPNVLIKGGDYKITEIVGYDIVKANGGEIKTIDFVEGQSSTNLIRKMK